MHEYHGRNGAGVINVSLYNNLDRRQRQQAETWKKKARNGVILRINTERPRACYRRLVNCWVAGALPSSFCDVGATRGSQQRDIDRVKRLARDWR